MGSQIGNRRFPNLSNTNSQKCENSFSHSCKLVLLYRRIVLHATCFTHSRKVANTSSRDMPLAYVKSYVLMFLCRKKSHHRSIQKYPIRCGNVVFFYRFPQVIDTFWAFCTYIMGVFNFPQ